MSASTSSASLPSAKRTSIIRGGFGLSQPTNGSTLSTRQLRGSVATNSGIGETPPASRVNTRDLLRPDINAKRSSPGGTPYDSEVFGNRILKNGWLHKRGKRKQWTRRWFVLRDHQLTLYKDEREYKPDDIIPTADIMSAAMVSDGHTANHFALFTSNQNLHLKADNAPDAQEWVDVLRSTAEGSEGVLSSSFQRLGFLGEQEASERYNKKHTFDTSLLHPHQPPQPQSPQLGPASFDLSTHDLPFFSGQSDAASPKPDGPTELAGAGMSSTAYGSEDDEKVIKRGYLLRLKKRLNQWKRQWVVLTTHRVVFYKSQGQTDKALKIIILENIADVVDIDPLSKSKKYCMQIITPEKRLRFCAETEEDLTSWLASLKSALARHQMSATV
jgi:hypothetical protein